MMSRTVRYFKLVYIVAGILMSNADICETVDKIQIAPRLEVRDILGVQRHRSRARLTEGSSSNNSKGIGIRSTSNLGLGLGITDVGNMSRNWLQKIDILGLSRIKRRVTPILRDFSIWTIPNYLIDCSTNYISSKFIISSDCDVIYHK